MVAAIEEIIRTTKKCVLVCANSNAACDEITERLLKVCETGEIFWMYAKSHNQQTISDEIKKSSNFLKSEFRIPCLDYIYAFRVVICTLQTAGCLSRACDEPGFNVRHFSHIINDECACTNETMTLIPIAGNFYFIFIDGLMLNTFSLIDTGLCTTPNEIKIKSYYCFVSSLEQKFGRMSQSYFKKVWGASRPQFKKNAIKHKLDLRSLGFLNDSKSNRI